MERPDVLKREIKALVFDQYGTIVDMQKGLTEAVTPFLAKKGWKGSPNSFVTWWRRTHFENSMIDALLDRGHTPYRQIGHRAVSYAWTAAASPTPRTRCAARRRDRAAETLPRRHRRPREAARRRLQARRSSPTAIPTC